MKPGELPEVQLSAANGVEFVDRKFGVVVHVHSSLLCRRGPSPHVWWTRQ
jgi:hypothetical protein